MAFSLPAGPNRFRLPVGDLGTIDFGAALSLVAHPRDPVKRRGFFCSWAVRGLAEWGRAAEPKAVAAAMDYGGMPAAMSALEKAMARGGRSAALLNVYMRHASADPVGASFLKAKAVVATIPKRLASGAIERGGVSEKTVRDTWSEFGTVAHIIWAMQAVRPDPRAGAQNLVEVLCFAEAIRSTAIMLKIPAAWRLFTFAGCPIPASFITMPGLDPHHLELIKGYRRKAKDQGKRKRKTSPIPKK